MESKKNAPKPTTKPKSFTNSKPKPVTKTTTSSQKNTSKEPTKPAPSSFTTGIIYHEEMLLHKSEHDHCENPKRLKSIIDRLNSLDTIKSSDVEVLTEFDEVDEELVNKAHKSDDYYSYIKNICPEDWQTQMGGDMFYNPHTSRAAFLAAGALKLAVDKVLTNSWKNSFCAIRPPGHHAASRGEKVFGFCFINNVVVGIKQAQEKYKVKRILVFDWDVHHGDSTQKLTYDDPNVLFISFHRYDDGYFFPGTKFGNYDQLGEEGKAEGYNLNLPWNILQAKNYRMLGNEDYVYAFERLVAPIIKKFKPELTFISCGFDSCHGDQLGQISVRPSGYAYITNQLTELTEGGKVIVALEGGYNFDNLADASETVFRVLRGESKNGPVKSVESQNKISYESLLAKALPTSFYFKRIEEVKGAWGKYWGECIDSDKKSQD